MQQLHLISFDIPYPPVYGGIIDVYYKVRALHNLGVEVTLHCFEYGKKKQTHLEQFCKSVHYYKRNSYLKSLLSKDIPFIVKSRGNTNLVNQLQKDTHPILFEGLHTTHVLNISDFKDRKLFVRAHNIEHLFYKGLAKSERNVFKRNIFKAEAKKLKTYEAILNTVDGIFSISPLEQSYFKEKYGSKTHYIPAFHEAKELHHNKPKGKSVLYHGDLRVSDNVKAALFLIDVYKNSSFSFVIASSYKNKDVLAETNRYSNISFCDIPSQKELDHLFSNAHVNVLLTFQQTGIKLKLLNSLYKGRFIIANDLMIDNTGLELLCEKANTKSEFLAKTEKLFQQEFTEKDVEKRKELLLHFNPTTAAQKMVDCIFKP